MTGLSYRVQPPAEARWSTLTLVCPSHPEAFLAKWRTFDGRNIVVQHNAESKWEHVGHYIPTEEERASWADSPIGRSMSTSVAIVEDDDAAHGRTVLSCDAVDCTRRYELRDTTVEHTIKRYVLAMWIKGIGHDVVDDPAGWIRDAKARIRPT